MANAIPTPTSQEFIKSCPVVLAHHEKNIADLKSLSQHTARQQHELVRRLDLVRKIKTVLANEKNKLAIAAVS